MRGGKALGSAVLLAVALSGTSGAANRTGSTRVGGDEYGKGGHYVGGVNEHPGKKGAKPRVRKPRPPTKGGK